VQIAVEGQTAAAAEVQIVVEEQTAAVEVQIVVEGQIAAAVVEQVQPFSAGLVGIAGIAL